MNVNSFAINYIPQKEDIIIHSCKYAFQGECQLLNKPCQGKSNKRKCKYFEIKYEL